MSRRASDAETVLLQRNDRIFFFFLHNDRQALCPRLKIRGIRGTWYIGFVLLGA